MMKCPQLNHTVAGREKALNYVVGLPMLETEGEYIYNLYHHYDIKPTDVYVKTSIEPAVFELLLARILFEASEINETYALGQEEIDHPILKGIYNVGVIEESDVVDEVFDLYTVWEKWCGKFNEVMGLKVFDRESLLEELKKIVPVE